MTIPFGEALINLVRILSTPTALWIFKSLNAISKMHLQDEY